MPGRGAVGLFAVCGLRGDELQPAHDRAGVAGTGMGARQAGAVGGLSAAKLKPRAKSDRGRCRYRRRILAVWAWPRLNQPLNASLLPSTFRAASEIRRFRPDTTY